MMEEGRGDKLQRRTLSNRLDDNSVEDILVKLPVKSLMRFKCVSKAWKSFIQNPAFVQLHLSRSRKHPQLFITISNGGGSQIFYSPEDGFEGGVAIHKVTVPLSYETATLEPIDGLCCFVDISKSVTCIYNLATRQATPWAITSVPALQGGWGASPMTSTYGFGFDPCTNTYKVLCLWERTSVVGYNVSEVSYICEVLTVGQNQWRKIDQVPPVRVHGEVVYANGSIYIKNADDKSLMFRPDKELIVAFDVGTEKFRVIQIPDIIVGSSSGTLRRRCSSDRPNLLQIDGHIGLMDRVDQYVVKLWISDDDCYKEEETMTTTWTEETISLPSSFLKGRSIYLNPVAGTDEIIIKAHIPSTENMPRGFASLYVYNRTMKSFREVQITGILLRSPCYHYGMFITHESLLPVQDAVEKLDEPTPMDTS